MKEVYLLLGSNKGNRVANINASCKLIGELCGRVIKSSYLYETAAWGLQEQQSFINQAIMVETFLAPQALLTILKGIENKMGREQTIKWGPRIIDVDILFYANEIINTEALKIPHPLIAERRFTLVPLNEIASGFVHPVFKKSIAQLLEECGDTLPVTRFLGKQI